MKLLDRVDIIFVTTLNGGPAKIRIYPDDTATLFIAQDIWESLPVESRIFVLLHELGHFALKTADEIKVDRWAFREYQKMGYSLSGAIKALSRVLKFNHPEHAERLKRQFYRSKHEHFLKTGNINQFNKHRL